MATTLYLREKASSGITGFRDAVAVAGSSATTGIVATNGSTQVQWTKTSGGAVLEWISGRSPVGGWTLDGIVTFSVWASESGTAANAGARARLFKRTAAGSESEVAGGPWDDGVEFTKDTATEMVWTGDPTLTAFAEDDRLIVRIYITNVGTMGSGQTCTLTYDAAAAATGDSLVTLTETVTFKPEIIERTPTPSALSVTEAVTRRWATSKALGQAVSVSENVARNLTAGPLSRSVSQAISAADSAKVVRSPVAVHAQETIAVEDSRVLSSEWSITLNTGENGPRGLVNEANYLWTSLYLNPGRVVRINAATQAWDTVTLTNDGNHLQPSIPIYIASKGKLYARVRSGSSNIIIVVEIDPDTLAVSDAINDTTARGYQTTHSQLGSVAADTTYLYVSVSDSADYGFLLRYSLSDWSYGGALAITQDIPSCIRYDGSKLYVSSIPRTGTSNDGQIVRINPGTFAVEQSHSFTSPAGANASTMALAGDYCWVATNNFATNVGTLNRVLKSDLDSVTQITFGVAGTINGVAYDGTHVVVLLAGSPGKVVRLDPDTLAWEYYDLPTTYNSPTASGVNGTSVCVAFAMSPGKVSAYPFSAFEFPKAIVSPLAVHSTAAVSVSDSVTPNIPSGPLACSVAETITAIDAGNFPTLQANFYPSIPQATNIGGVSADAQTFPSGAGYAMVGASVAYQILAAIGTNTVTLSLRAVGGDTKPTGPDLASATVALRNLEPGGYPWEFFPMQYTLSASTQYALFLRCTPYNASAPQSVIGWSFINNEYAGGTQWGTGDLGATWVGAAIGDCGFRVWSGTASPLQIARLKASVGGNWFVNNGIIRVVDAVTAAVSGGAPLARSVSETVSVTDFFAKGVVAPLAAHATETRTVTDVAKAVVKLGTRRTESVSVSETRKSVVSPLATHRADAISVTDAAATGGDLLLSRAEAATVAEFRKSVVSPVAVHSADAITAVDNIKAVVKLGKRPAEAISAADVVTAAAQLGRRLAEAIAALDNLKGVASPLATHRAEAISVTDSSEEQATGAGALARAVNDPVSVTDSAHPAIPALSRQLAEALSVTDSASKSTAQAEVGSQALMVVLETDGTNAQAWIGSQALLIVLELFPDASVSEAISIADAVTAALAAGPASRSVSDSVTVSEFVKGVRSPLAVHATETIGISDAVTVGGKRTANVADSVVVSEFLRTVRSPLAVHASDAVSVSDAIVANMPLGRAVASAIAVTEFAKAVRTLGEVLSEAVAVADSAETQVTSVGSLARSLSEQIAATDFAKIALSLAAKREELISVADFANASVTPLLRLLTEAITVADVISQSTELRLSLAETAAVLEAVTANLATAPSFQAEPYETIGVTDAATPLLAFDYESRGRRHMFETPAEASALGSRIFETPAEATASGSRIF